jgi:hypothetical protein
MSGLWLDDVRGRRGRNVGVAARMTLEQSAAVGHFVVTHEPDPASKVSIARLIVHASMMPPDGVFKPDPVRPQREIPQARPG